MGLCGKGGISEASLLRGMAGNNIDPPDHHFPIQMPLSCRRRHPHAKSSATSLDPGKALVQLTRS